MMSALLIAGTVAVLAGLGAIAYGIPVKEFSFGNTMVLAGTITVCTGLLLFGLSAVLGELKMMSHRLRLRLSPDGSPKALQLPGSDRDTDEQVDLAAAPPMEDLWREGGTPRGRGGRTVERPMLPEPEPEPEPIAPESNKPRRNLFFEAAARRQRERAEKRPAESGLPDFRAPPLSEPAESADEPAPPASPPSFEEAWPKPERARAPEPALPPLPPLPRRPARAAPAFSESLVPSRPPEPAAVTVIKSGVVDGMAYSLYSDGSIEAQMPEGMMRFASIDELRTHLDQRS
ncbi:MULTISPECIES: hypothetical protein [unclassified Bradyrhizobium]|uniref:hypothetical protein n=1 Tax=unclassified Bradyrhizobium TaxID=2631580 RepID=UPI0028E9E0EE|nr:MULTISPECIES: hypothetical protein [unclassified Bradyrhizobium]